MKALYMLSLLLAALVLTPRAMADAVALQNGDRLTGTITGSDGKQVTLKTDYAGEIKIQWSAIKETASEKTLYVVTSRQKTVSGTIALENSVLIVHAKSGDVQVPLAQLAIVRSEADEQVYEKSLHPSLLNGWAGNGQVGFALARGNSSTTNVDIAVNADRKTLSDNIKLYESSIYTKNDAAVGGGVIASEILGGARYDRNITKTLFAFVSGDFAHDALQDLDLRGIYTGGLAAHVINNPRTTFDVLGGVNYTRETYTASATSATPGANVARNLPALTVGEDFTHKMGKSTLLTEQFYFYPDLSSLSQYRLALDATAATKISKWFGWQVSVSDRYVTDPPFAGTKPNDIILSTGLNIQFAH